MSALAHIVQSGDPDRYAASLAAPEDMRARLWALYAFNLEVARAPWVTSEPMIAEMRLQFWHDTLDGIAEGTPARAHEVASPLAQVWRDCALPVELGHAMVAARRWDIARNGFGDAQALAAHLDATSGHLMWLAALALSTGPQAEPVVRDMAHAAGLANWFLAVPELQARGRQPLPDPSPEAIRALAGDGLSRLKRARAQRAIVPAEAAPALLTGWQAGAILRRAVQDPARVTAGTLGLSEFARRGRLLLRGLSGRW
ncbi:MAG: phytoene synthase [Rhodobacteraceae bacterium]|nr:MAG: phytoene synthase [Paracoccaceae bacterium]